MAKSIFDIFEEYWSIHNDRNKKFTVEDFEKAGWNITYPGNNEPPKKTFVKENVKKDLNIIQKMIVFRFLFNIENAEKTWFDDV